MTPTAGRLVLLGTDSPLTATVFDTLAGTPYRPLAVGVAGLPAGNRVFFHGGAGAGLAQEVAARGVALRGLTAAAAADTARWLESMAPDVILVACFPWRLPESLRAMARQACLNLHPSLLPRYRGPAPLFWQLRGGEQPLGVTLHTVVDRFDAGPIVARARYHAADGQHGATIEARLGRLGGRLVVEALAASGGAAPPAGPQDEALASYQPLPSGEDFRVSADWSARRIFNFMRGTAHWGQVYPVDAGGRTWRLTHAVAYDSDGTLARRVEVVGDAVRIRCRPGLLEAAYRAG